MLFTRVPKGPLRVPMCNIAKHGVKWRHRPGIDGIYNGLGRGPPETPETPREPPGAPREPKRSQDEARNQGNMV